MISQAEREGGDHLMIIEGLRGLASLMVVYAHYWVTAGIEAGVTSFAFTGVNLFFVLSGFVFAPYFFGRHLTILPFLIRRICRIYPLYVIGVLVYAAQRGYDDQTIGLVIRHLLFMHTAESFEIAFALNSAFWSLPPEVEFYLALALFSVCSRGKYFMPGIVMVALISRLFISLNEPQVSGVVNWALILNAHLPGLLIEFLIGVGIWRLTHSRAGIGLRRLIGLAGSFLLCLTAWRFEQLGEAVRQDDLLRGNLGLLAAVAYGAMLAWVSGLKPQRSWTLALCHWGGALSFGTYIFHNTTLYWALKLTGWGSGLPVVALATISCLALALTLHLWVEAPMRAVGRRWSARWT